MGNADRSVEPADNSLQFVGDAKQSQIPTAVPKKQSFHDLSAWISGRVSSQFLQRALTFNSGGNGIIAWAALLQAHRALRRDPSRAGELQREIIDSHAVLRQKIQAWSTYREKRFIVVIKLEDYSNSELAKPA